MPPVALLSARLAAALAGALALAGCGHVPLSTMARLRSFDAMTLDPAQLRIAIRAPDWIEPRPDGAKLTFKVSRDGALLREEAFVLEPAEELAERARLAAFQRRGERIAPLRVSTADADRIRALQMEMQALRAAGAGKTALSVAAAVEACRRGETPAGPIRTTTLLQPDPATGYLVLLDEVDLRETARKAGVDLTEKLPPCGKSTLRAP